MFEGLPIISLPVDPARLVSYMAAMAVVAATPGPAILFSIATGVEKGPRAVLAGAIGMNCATLVWFGASALGLGALISAFPQTFHMLALLSAAYLAWLGVSAILGALRTQARLKPSFLPTGKNAFTSGFLVQITNPKVLLFFAAVLPPFLNPDRPMAAQLVTFAVISVTADMTAMTAYGLGGAALATRMTRPGPSRLFGLVVGGLLICAAIVVLVRQFQI